MKYLLYFIFLLPAFITSAARAQTGLQSDSTHFYTPRFRPLPASPAVMPGNSTDVYMRPRFIGSSYFTELPGLIVPPFISMTWFVYFPGKWVSNDAQVKMGLRRTNDFAVFFPAPHRIDEAAVNVDRVRLINP